MIQNQNIFYHFDTACWYKPNDSAKALLNLNQGTLLVDLDTMEFGVLRGRTPTTTSTTGLLTSIIIGGGIPMTMGYQFSSKTNIIQNTLGPGLLIGGLATGIYALITQHTEEFTEVYSLKDSINNKEFKHFFPRCVDTPLVNQNQSTQESAMRKMFGVQINLEYISRNHYFNHLYFGSPKYIYRIKNVNFEKWGKASHVCKTDHGVQYKNIDNQIVVDTLSNFRQLLYVNSNLIAEPIQFHLDSLPICSEFENLDSLKKATRLKRTQNTWLISYSQKLLPDTFYKSMNPDHTIYFLGIGHSLPYVQFYKDLHFISLQYAHKGQLFLNYHAEFPIFKAFGISPSYTTSMTNTSEHTFDLDLYSKIGVTILGGISWGALYKKKGLGYNLGMNFPF